MNFSPFYLQFEQLSFSGSGWGVNGVRPSLFFTILSSGHFLMAKLNQQPNWLGFVRADPPAVLVAAEVAGGTFGLPFGSALPCVRRPPAAAAAGGLVPLEVEGEGPISDRKRRTVSIIWEESGQSESSILTASVFLRCAAAWCEPADVGSWPPPDEERCFKPGDWKAQPLPLLLPALDCSCMVGGGTGTSPAVEEELATSAAVIRRGTPCIAEARLRTRSAAATTVEESSCEYLCSAAAAAAKSERNATMASSSFSCRV
jgi:hypothetical protein